MPTPARLLDLTRLVSRLGKGQPTGIDRVEAAYLAHFLSLQTPVFALVRSRLGFLLLDKSGMTAFHDLLGVDGPFPPADIISRLTRYSDPLLARAETAIRALSIERCSLPRLPRVLRQHLVHGFTYFNTGHANLNNKSFKALKAGGAKTLAVLIHDTIPVDHPEFTRPDTIGHFDTKLSVVAKSADLVIHTAQATRDLTDQHFARHGRIPPGLVAHLGITPLQPGSMSPRAHPYFVALGTIEPRKNHALLLDIWEDMHCRLPEEEIPHLLILGRRGWSNELLFQRLDSLPFRNKTVFEMPGLPDEMVASLLSNARALLFPSFVEGFGLPPLEAASLGAAVIVPPLPIYQETLGNYPVYASLNDSYSWMETIIRLKDGGQTQELAGQEREDTDICVVAIPRWDAHFNTVLSLV